MTKSLTRKIEGYGIVYKQQAHIVAWRAWNKIQFQAINCRFHVLPKVSWLVVGILWR